MTHADALAAAIRRRLVDGQPAPLPGLGTLVRQHVSARVETRPDGSRVLVPPGETVGLAPASAATEGLAPTFAAVQGLPAGQAEDAFAEAMDQIEARLAATGEVRLPGVGLLRRTSGGVVLGVEEDLLTDVNEAFGGLRPVAAPPVGGAHRGPAPETPPAPPESSFFDPRDAEVTEDGASDEVAWDDPLGTAVAQDESAPRAEDDPAYGEPGDDALSSEEADGEAEADPTTEPAPTASLAVPFGVGAEAESLRDLLPPTDPADDPAAEAGPDDPDAEDEPAADGAAPEASPTPDRPTPLPDADPSEDGLAAEDDRDEFEDWLTPPPPVAVASRHEDEATMAQEDGQTALPELATEPAGFTALAEEHGPSVEPAPPPAPPSRSVDFVHGVPVERVEPGAEAPPAAGADRPVGFAAPSDPSYAGPDTEGPPADRPLASASPLRPWWVWALALALLAFVAALVWALWSRAQVGAPDPTSEPATPPGAVAMADPPPDASASEAPLDPPVGDVPEGSASSAATPPTGADAPPSTGAETARRANEAVLPPRVVGLPDGDVRALSGGPVDPTAEAWTLVVFSTPLESEAEAQAVRYREAGYRTGVVQARVAGRTWYRTAVGQFASEADARRLLDRLPPQAPAGSWPLDLRTL